MRKAKKVLNLVFTNYFDHSVSKNAAALAYYLLFALFPLLIFFSNLLGNLKFDIFSIIHNLDRVLPRDVVNVVESYLEYVSLNSSKALMWFSLVFSVWFPMRAIKGLMDDVRRAYELPRPKNQFKYIIKQLVFTVVFLVVLILTLVLSTVGENLLLYVDGILPESIFGVSNSYINAWQYLRFLLIAILLVGAIGILYLVALDRKKPLKTVLPGMLFAVVFWVIISVGFSFYVENFSNYSLIYGALGAVIVLLIWLYMTALILILGAELNSAIDKVRKEEGAAK